MKRSVARGKLFGRWRNVPAWARDLARAGYVGKALVYGLLGSFALSDAIARTHSHAGAMETMHLLRAYLPGTVTLALLAAGTCCYGIHRAVESVLGPVRTDSHLMEVFHRLGRFGGGLAYLGLTVLALEFVFSRHRSSQSHTVSLAARVMRLPLGNSILVIIGAILTGIGIKYSYDALSTRYRRSFELGHANHALEIAAELVAAFGICARALFFLLCGGLVIHSGIASDPSTARGMQGVVGMVQKLPFGDWLFALLACGFISYGLFCIVRAIWGKYPSDMGV